MVGINPAWLYNAWRLQDLTAAAKLLQNERWNSNEQCSVIIYALCKTSTDCRGSFFKAFVNKTLPNIYLDLFFVIMLEGFAIVVYWFGIFFNIYYSAPERINHANKN